MKNPLPVGLQATSCTGPFSGGTKHCASPAALVDARTATSTASITIYGASDLSISALKLLSAEPRFGWYEGNRESETEQQAVPSTFLRAQEVERGGAVVGLVVHIARHRDLEKHGVRVSDQSTLNYTENYMKHTSIHTKTAKTLRTSVACAWSLDYVSPETHRKLYCTSILKL